MDLDTYEALGYSRKLLEELGVGISILEELFTEFVQSDEYLDIIRVAEEADLCNLLNQLKRCIDKIGERDKIILDALRRYKSKRNLTDFNVRMLIVRANEALGDPGYTEFFTIIKATCLKLGIQTN